MLSSTDNDLKILKIWTSYEIKWAIECEECSEYRQSV
jgi:hypothetical protein